MTNLFERPNRFVSKVFIHCSASDNPQHDDISVIRKWHMSKDPNDASKPWSDVGYHFYIRKDGMLQKGRSLNRSPSAQAGHNAGSIAICLGGLAKEKFTVAQFNTLRSLCQEMAMEYAQHLSFHGHCEVSSKACPVFDYKQVLNLDPLGYIRYPLRIK